RCDSARLVADPHAGRDRNVRDRTERDQTAPHLCAGEPASAIGLVEPIELDRHGAHRALLSQPGSLPATDRNVGLPRIRRVYRHLRASRRDRALVAAARVAVGGIGSDLPRTGVRRWTPCSLDDRARGPAVFVTALAVARADSVRD